MMEAFILVAWSILEPMDYLPERGAAGPISGSNHLVPASPPPIPYRSSLPAPFTTIS